MTPRHDYLIAKLDRLLALHTLDGTEGHALLEELVATVSGAKGDLVRLRSALLDAKLRLRALTEGTVPRETVNNAVCAIAENWR